MCVCCFFTTTPSPVSSSLSLHDALPIFLGLLALIAARRWWPAGLAVGLIYALGLAPVSGLAHAGPQLGEPAHGRSEEHTSELQSLRHLVCRLLLGKKNRLRI